MGESIQVTLTLGMDQESDKLHEYLTAPAFRYFQHLKMVSGERIGPDNENDYNFCHEGSKQGGLLSIYVGNLHDVSWAKVEDYLHNAPWDGVEAVLVIHRENDRAYIDRLGFDPVRRG